MTTPGIASHPTTDVPGPARRATRWTVLGAVSAAILLLAFPLLRPWPDETTRSLALAADLASDRWVVAHLCGIAGLGLLAPTFLGLRAVLAGRTPAAGGRRGTRAATAAVVTAWLGAGLCALYYGAEIFGIRTIAQAAVRTGDLTLLGDVDVLRYQPAAVVVFALGLALVAAAGVLVAAALWRTAGRWAGLVTAAGLVLYLPQFFGTPAVRISHGVLIALGLLLLAWAVTRSRTTTAGHPEG